MFSVLVFTTVVPLGATIDDHVYVSVSSDMGYALLETIADRQDVANEIQFR